MCVYVCSGQPLTPDSPTSISQVLGLQNCAPALRLRGYCPSTLAWYVQQAWGPGLSDMILICSYVHIFPTYLNISTYSKRIFIKLVASKPQ